MTRSKIRTVSVPDKDQDLWHQGSLIAGRRGISMSALVLQSLEKEVQRCDHKFVDSDICLKCGWQPV